jgi:diguanylate cyclase (GGDEF)-like protein
VRELYAIALGLALLVGAAALAWGRALAWHIARPLAALAAAVRAVAPDGREARDASATPEALPPGADPRAPLEVRTLAAHLARMEARVAPPTPRCAPRWRRARARSRRARASSPRRTRRSRSWRARIRSPGCSTGAASTPIAERELAAAHRSGTPCLLLYGDLDLFKAINDAHGHAVGDTALVAFATVLRETFRVADVIARLGGDEFAVLVYGAGAADEARVRERLDAALEALATSGRHPFVLQASFGAAYGDPQRPRTLHALLRDADAALYQCKRARRAGRVDARGGRHAA